jgi:hypothetical protein
LSAKNLSGVMQYGVVGNEESSQSVHPQNIVCDENWICRRTRLFHIHSSGRCLQQSRRYMLQ